MALLNTWASQQDQATLSPLDRLLNNYIQKGDAPLSYLMRGDAQGLLKDLNTPKPVNMTQDMTDLALNLNPVMGLIGATAFHGSPYLFDKFNPTKVGTGTGLQEYGYGTYFAENPKVADYYKFQLKPSEEYLQKVSKGEYNDLSNLVTEGNLYKVDIPDEYIPKMLDWNKPLKEQNLPIKDLLSQFKGDRLGRITAYAKNDDVPAGSFYRALTDELGSQEKATKALQKAGISGVKYLDATSRDLGQGTRNFVVFDPSNVKIIERNNKGLLK